MRKAHSNTQVKNSINSYLCKQHCSVNLCKCCTVKLCLIATKMLAFHLNSSRNQNYSHNTYRRKTPIYNIMNAVFTYQICADVCIQ